MMMVRLVAQLSAVLISSMIRWVAWIPHGTLPLNKGWTHQQSILIVEELTTVHIIGGTSLMIRRHKDSRPCKAWGAKEFPQRRMLPCISLVHSTQCLTTDCGSLVGLLWMAVFCAILRRISVIRDYFSFVLHDMHLVRLAAILFGELPLKILHCVDARLQQLDGKTL